MPDEADCQGTESSKRLELRRQEWRTQKSHLVRRVRMGCSFAGLAFITRIGWPNRQRDWIPEDHPDLLENIHRGFIDALNVLRIHEIAKRQVSPQRGEHIHF